MWLTALHKGLLGTLSNIYVGAFLQKKIPAINVWQRYNAPLSELNIAIFLNYVWLFFNIMNERVKPKQDRVSVKLQSSAENL